MSVSTSFSATFDFGFDNGVSFSAFFCETQQSSTIEMPNRFTVHLVHRLFDFTATFYREVIGQIPG